VRRCLLRKEKYESRNDGHTSTIFFFVAEKLCEKFRRTAIQNSIQPACQVARMLLQRGKCNCESAREPAEFCSCPKFKSCKRSFAPPGEDGFARDPKALNTFVSLAKLNSMEGSGFPPSLRGEQSRCVCILWDGLRSFILKVRHKAVVRIRSRYFSCPSVRSNLTGVTARRRTDFAHG
jgi:hypothetical protein